MALNLNYILEELWLYSVKSFESITKFDSIIFHSSNTMPMIVANEKLCRTIRFKTRIKRHRNPSVNFPT